MLPVWEETFVEIEGKLLTLTVDELACLCQLLGIEEKNDDSPRILRRRILQYLEGEDVVSLEDEGLALLLQLNEKIDCLRADGPGEKRDESGDKEAGSDNAEVATVAVKQKGEVDENQNTLNKLSIDEAERNDVIQLENSTAVTRNRANVHPLYRRELKIIGQIGEPNQRDKLNFTSLDRQIYRALQKGYDEGEVIEFKQ